MPSEYFIKRGEQITGPFATSTIRQLAGEGLLQPNDELGKHCGGPWAPASKAKGLFPVREPMVAKCADTSDKSNQPQKDSLESATGAETGDATTRDTEPSESWISQLVSATQPVLNALRANRTLVIKRTLVIGVCASIYMFAGTTISYFIPPKRSERTLDILTGPKIKGLQLGMSLEKVKNAFRELNHGVNVNFEEFETPDRALDRLIKFKYKVMSDGELLGIVWFDKLIGVTMFEIGSNLSDAAFNSKELNDTQFLQNFVDAYQIPSLAPIAETAFRYQTFEYRDPKGWRVEVVIVEPLLTNTHGRSIIVQRTTSDTELNFD